MKKIVVAITMMFIVSASYGDIPDVGISQIPTSLIGLPTILKVTAYEYAERDRIFRVYKHYRMAAKELDNPHDPDVPEGITIDDWYLENCVLYFLAEADLDQKMAAIEVLGIDPETINLKQGTDMKLIVVTELAKRKELMLTYIQSVQ